MQAEEILPTLYELLDEAKITSPHFTNNLNSLIKWIKDKPPGKIRQKKYLAAILVQLIADLRLLLYLNKLTDIQKQRFLLTLTPSEQYWFETLLPQWFVKKDEYFSTWKQKVMNNEFEDKDQSFRNALVLVIKQNNGSSLWRYLLDLSMATDIIVSYLLEKPLCVQYTISSPRNTINKKQVWENILRYWNINRGIFVHISSSQIPTQKIQNLRELVFLALGESDVLLDSCYSEHDIS